MTAFDTDIRVPLIVSGPGVAPGTHTDAMAENIDLAKTFAELAGTTMMGDGHSLVPLLAGQDSGDWRNAILVEHHGPDVHRDDPDFQETGGGNPPSYEAMRTHRFLYVEYADGETEYYDLRRDPFELDNLSPALTPSQRALLHAELTELESCHDGAGCWTAMHVDQARPAVDIRRGATGSRRAQRRHHHRRR
jgi:N-acetylglucosamine-6-sulfatase